MLNFRVVAPAKNIHGTQPGVGHLETAVRCKSNGVRAISPYLCKPVDSYSVRIGDQALVNVAGRSS